MYISKAHVPTIIVDDIVQILDILINIHHLLQYKLLNKH